MELGIKGITFSSEGPGNWGVPGICQNTAKIPCKKTFKMIENRYEYFTSYKDMTSSYIYERLILD